MPDYNFKNNLKSTLQAKLWSDATSIYCNHVVNSTDANARRNAWPAFPFTLTLVNTVNDNIEVIKCTGLASNSSDLIAFTCARAQESTTAQTFEIATTSVEHRLTSGALNSIISTQASPTVEGHVKLDALAADGSNTAAPGGFGLGMPEAKQIPANTDLDTVVLPGFYSCKLNATAATLLNCPTKTAFSMLVEFGAYGPTQTITVYIIGARFQRTKSAPTTFGPWRSLPNGITDSTATASSTVAASATAVKAVNDTTVQLAGALNAITGSLDEITSNVSESLAQHVGSVISVLATDTYVPTGCVPCNGTEYTRAQFPTLYDSYLTAATPKLLTCTYTEWSTQVGLTGNCAKFAVDKANQKFKVPLLKNGDSITQAASAAELGKSYKAGLPNIEGWTGLVSADGTLTGPFYKGAAVYGVTGVGYSTNPGVYFGSNRANAIYGNSTTVTDEQVRLRHFVVVASAQNNQSVFDWSNYMAGLAGKANLDMDNLTQIGSTKIANIAMPSGRSIDYAAPSVSGQAYTAPGDGYFAVQLLHSTGLSIVTLVNAGAGFGSGSTVPSGEVTACVPCAKGQTINLYYYNVGGTWNFVRFVFAGGAY